MTPGSCIVRTVSLHVRWWACSSRTRRLRELLHRNTPAPPIRARWPVKGRDKLLPVVEAEGSTRTDDPIGREARAIIRTTKKLDFTADVAGC